jgi:hypothetical protein
VLNGRVPTEVAVAYFKVLFLHSFGGAEENNETPQSGQHAFWSRTEQGPPKHEQHDNHPTVTFGRNILCDSVFIYCAKI